VLMMVGKVHCEVADPDELPESLRKQARVRKLLERRYANVMHERAAGATASSR